jgi:hypothetical protein
MLKAKRKTNATGRSGVFKDPKQAAGVWANQRWTSIGQDLLESYAWRAASGAARNVIDRIVLEHLHHGSLENGILPVTYDDFVKYGVRRMSVRQALEEASALGLIDITPGVRAWGDFKGKPSQYRLTWFGTKERAPPTNRWKRFGTMEEAKAAAKAARDSISSSPTKPSNVFPLRPTRATS